MDAAANTVETLLRAGVVAKSLALGWEPRELVGIWRHKPHDLQCYAGLIFSVRRGDTVRAVRPAGCAIDIAGSNLQHLWRRVPLTPATVLPWELNV